jgi:hypothetical protein
MPDFAFFDVLFKNISKIFFRRKMIKTPEKIEIKNDDIIYKKRMHYFYSKNNPSEVLVLSILSGE